MSKDTSIQPDLFTSEQATTTTPPPALNDAERDGLLEALLALKAHKGIGFKTLCAMFDAGYLHRLAWGEKAQTRILWAQIATQFHLTSTTFEQEAFLAGGAQAASELAKHEIWFAPLGHPSYPPNLRRLAEPPRWIFGLGSQAVVQSNAIVAVVGTRTASEAGMKLAYACASELAQRNFVVLSGLAKGIDTKAHQGATDYYGQSVAVLGHGLLASEATAVEWAGILGMDGAVISEYLPTDAPSRKTFLRRNELQAALSKVVIPVECPSLESGTGATIRRALIIGTPVIGIFPNESAEKALLQTRSNLTQLSLPVFTVFGGNSAEFWEHLQKLLPEQDLSTQASARQDRFLKTVTWQIVAAQKRIGLDELAIDRFAENLKRALRE